MIALSATYLFPSLSIGLLISTLAKNQFVAAQASIIAGFLPSFILSGFLFEIANMPKGLQIATHIVPARYFVEFADYFFGGRHIYYFYSRRNLDDSDRLLVFALIIKKSKEAVSARPFICPDKKRVFGY